MATFDSMFSIFFIFFWIMFAFVAFSIVKGVRYQHRMMDHHLDQLGLSRPRSRRSHTRTCRYCGTSTTDDKANHCSHCGAHLEPVQDE